MTKKGIAGQLLRVNLTTKVVTKEELPLEMFIEYLGGRGLGAYYLNKEVDPKTDGLSPENKLIFFKGPFSGTMVPGNSRMNLTFKSPLTNTYPYYLCGGHFGPELKFACITSNAFRELVDLETMLDSYYPVMGWDNNGIPTEEKLKALEL